MDKLLSSCVPIVVLSDQALVEAIRNSKEHLEVARSTAEKETEILAKQIDKIRIARDTLVQYYTVDLPTELQNRRDAYKQRLAKLDTVPAIQQVTPAIQQVTPAIQQVTPSNLPVEPSDNKTEKDVIVLMPPSVPTVIQIATCAVKQTEEITHTTICIECPEAKINMSAITSMLMAVCQVYWIKAVSADILVAKLQGTKDVELAMSSRLHFIPRNTSSCVTPVITQWFEDLPIDSRMIEISQ